MVYIWVRATIDWGDEQEFRARVDRELHLKIEVWNDTFNIPFRIFRQRVREIAQLNHSRVENAVCAAWEEIPDGALVLPVDDDDWFAPDAAVAAESEHDPQGVGCYWPSSFIEVPIHVWHRLGLIRRRVLPRTPPKYICTTNNYAMVKSPATELLLRRHARASEWFTSGGGASMRRIERRLSLHNRTLASTTSLRMDKPVISRSRLIWKFHRYQRLYRRFDVPELAWSRPYVAMMADLMGELRVSSA